MEVQFTGIRAQQGSPVHEAISAVRYLTARDGREPVLLAETPVARINPYQHLIYRNFADQGFAVTPVVNPWGFDSLVKLSGQVAGIVLHLHWLSFVMASATSRAEAVKSSARFLEQVRTFRASGGKVVWTVHNPVTHDATYVQEELRLQQAVAAEADLIHVMSQDTPEVLRNHLELPADRLVHVPHPSYRGAYADLLSRDQARLTLGIEPDEVVYVVFGAIRAYKGIERFVAGFNRLLERSEVPRRLIVAGQPAIDDRTQSLLRELRAHPYVLLQDVRIPSDTVQYHLRAADLMVLPHLQALNSGGALLGPTFDLPLVASPVGVLPGLLEPDFAEFLRGESADDVADSLTRADRLVEEKARAAARAFADRHDPAELSGRLAQTIRCGLGLGEHVPT